MRIPFTNLNLVWGQTKEPQAYNRYSGWSGSNMQAIYDGEKTPYEMGNPYTFQLDYQSLRARSWEAFLQTDVVQNAILKYCMWVVGSGLKLQADPNEHILKNVSPADLDLFIKDTEANFRIYANSKHSTYSGEIDLHTQAAEALKNCVLAGDVLCIVRVENGNVVTDLIDGYYVRTSMMSGFYDEAKKKGNDIIDGVEITKSGSHVAYYIMQSDMTYAKIPAYGQKSGMRMAWLMYGRTHKIKDTRGMSLLSAVLENASKLDRYKDATVGTAEENAKIPYTIEHASYSEGENPFINQIAQSVGKGRATAPETQTDHADILATKIAQTTNKMAYNMPKGAKLMRNEFKADGQFKDFFLVNIDILYATLGIPAEVALDKFGGSYSSSRAALKSWEYNMMVNRANLLKKQFYKPIYDIWLDINILQNKITAPGYLEAMQKKDYQTLEAYRNCRFIGATVPHIDPVKEVNAERLKLGKTFDNVPITTAEQSCENLNTGDFENVIKKARNEKTISNDFNPEPDTNNNRSGV